MANVKWDFNLTDLTDEELTSNLSMRQNLDPSVVLENVSGLSNEERKQQTAIWCETVAQNSLSAPCSLRAISAHALHKYFNMKGMFSEDLKETMCELVEHQNIPKLLADYVEGTYVPLHVRTKQQYYDSKLLSEVLSKLPLNWFCSGSYAACILGDIDEYNDVDLFTVVPAWFDIEYYKSQVLDPFSLPKLKTFKQSFNDMPDGYLSEYATCPSWRFTNSRLFLAGRKTRISLNFLSTVNMDSTTSLSMQLDMKYMIFHVLKGFDLDVVRAVGVYTPFTQKAVYPSAERIHEMNMTFCRLTHCSPMTLQQTFDLESFFLKVLSHKFEPREVLKLVREHSNIYRYIQSLLIDVGCLVHDSETEQQQLETKNKVRAIVRKQRERCNKYNARYHKSEERLSLHSVQQSRILFLNDM